MPVDSARLDMIDLDKTSSASRIGVLLQVQRYYREILQEEA